MAEKKTRDSPSKGPLRRRKKRLGISTGLKATELGAASPTEEVLGLAGTIESDGG